MMNTKELSTLQRRIVDAMNSKEKARQAYEIALKSVGEASAFLEGLQTAAEAMGLYRDGTPKEEIEQ